MSQIKDMVILVNQALKEIMQPNVHYGVIPGCGSKPTLLKPGTEKLCLLFRLSPTFEIIARNLEENHREYEIITTLRHINTGEVWAQGVGCCSTKETKYAKRKDGSPSPNPIDVYNTVLKMAKKRSQTDAVLTATGASDIFTQDIKDLVDNGVIQPKQEPQKQTVKPKQEQKPLEKFSELQPVHQKKLDELCEKMVKCVNDVELDDVYGKAQDIFETSTSLTDGCIKTTLDALKCIYEDSYKTLNKK
jgi:hypothetical protein